METNIYAYLTPLAIFFVLLEVGINWYYDKGLIRFQEFVANFGTAIGNQTMNVLVMAGVYIVYGYLWDNYRIMTIEMNVLNFFLLLLAVDFVFYWVHRWGHEVNILWAAHSPHHSAEEMNFAVALRSSVTQRLFSFFFFWILTIIGFHPYDIYMMTGIHLFIAFLHHTELIPKLWRWIEFLFTTPSHHRVHHGINFRYLDKNYGEFLIIWDRIFGTFEEETEKVIYGMYSPPNTWNPITINFHYYRILWQDAVDAPYVWDKFRLWFMPLGWRPRGLTPKPPLVEVTQQNQVKYSSNAFKNANPYLVLQLALSLGLMLIVIKANSPWETWQRWIGGFLLWFSIINWAGILESKKWLLPSELIRIPLTLLCVFAFSQILPFSILGISLITVAMGCAIWTILYFKR